MVPLRVGEWIDRDKMLAQLVNIQYDRNDVSFKRGKSRVRGERLKTGWPNCAGRRTFTSSVE